MSSLAPLVVAYKRSHKDSWVIIRLLTQRVTLGLGLALPSMWPYQRAHRVRVSARVLGLGLYPALLAGTCDLMKDPCSARQGSIVRGSIMPHTRGAPLGCHAVLS